MYSVHSTLAIQNRGLHQATTGDNQEDINVVDSVPLQGKIYTGKGSGTWVKSANAAAPKLIAQRTIPYIPYAPTSAGVEELQEPPPADRLVGVSGCGKLKLEPGELKRNHLQDKYQGSASKLFRILAPLIANTYNTSKMFGKFAIVGLEKMLQLKDSTNDFAVKLAWEINFTEYVLASVKKQKQGPICRFTKEDDITITSGGPIAWPGPVPP